MNNVPHSWCQYLGDVRNRLRNWTGIAGMCIHALLLFQTSYVTSAMSLVRFRHMKHRLSDLAAVHWIILCNKGTITLPLWQ